MLLYHLGVGFGARPGDNLDPRTLSYTHDGDDLQVLPSFGIVAPTFHDTDPPSLDLPGCDIDLAQVVHGSQEIVLHRPLPTSGSGTVSTRISDVWDKGKAAVIVQEGTAVDDSGEPLFTTRSSIFARGEGGFGGERGPSGKVEVPERAPDFVIETPTLPQQAFLYRLCGDRNPLHADPEFAQRAGFDAPILHGLCTYGVVCKAVIDAVLDGPEQVASFGAKFAGVVFPGETLTTQVWRDGPRLVLTTSAGDRPVLADAVLTLTED